MRHRSFISKWTSVIIILLLSFFTWSFGQKYKWLEDDATYDCVVGITVDDKPVSTGVLVRKDSIVTSANAIERHKNEQIKVHLINGSPDKKLSRNIVTASRNQALRNTEDWFTLGLDDKHCPLHDFVIIYLSPEIANSVDTAPRTPYHALWCCDTKLPVFKQKGRLSIAGFGFIDKTHVKENVDLELVEYSYEDVYEDCDRWIPAYWGTFICLANIESFVGVSSGAGLFYNGVLVGIGAFSLKTDGKGILLFTDQRPYCYPPAYLYVLPE